MVPTWRVLARRFSRADREHALRCLDTVGLCDRAATRADQLSGGQQQRVAVVASLHQVPYACPYADRIVALRDGRVVDDVPAAGIDPRALEHIYRNGTARP
jgi:phosphonate transport system ATP-binding protein